jgi:hypothetical protein
LIRAEEMKNGLTRRGPLASSSRAVSAIVDRPPMPEPRMTPVRHLSSSVSGNPARILHGFVGGGDAVQDEVVDALLVARAHGQVGVERALDVGAAAAASIDARHFAGHLAGVFGRIEGRDPVRAGLAGQDVLPGDIDALTQRGQEAKPGDDDSTHGSLPTFDRGHMGI